MIVSPEPKGTYYYIAWRPVWPAIRMLAQWLPGPLGLRAPDNRKLAAPFVRYVCNKIAFFSGHQWSAEYERKLERWNWWELYIWQSVRRVIGRNHGGSVTIAIGLLAIAITMIAIAAERYSGGPFYGVTVAILAITMYLMAAMIAWAAYASLRTATPEEYSEIALLGKTDSQIFRALSYEMLGGCRESLEMIAPLESILNSSFRQRLRDRQAFITDHHGQDIVDPEWQVLMADWSMSLDKFESRSSELDEIMLRLLTLKIRAADQLSISPQRLCENILEYSPANHHELVILYGRIWTRLLATAGRLQTNADPKNIQRYIERCQRQKARCGKIRYQLTAWSDDLADLWRFKSTHRYLQRIASKHSTSGAVEEYAYGLAKIARPVCEANSARFASIVPRAVDKLEFLYGRQKAYPGLSVNSSLRRLCEHARTPVVMAQLDVRERDIDLQIEVLTCIRSDDDTERYLLQQDNDVLRMRYGAIRQIPDTVDQLLTWTRDELGRRLLATVNQWQPDSRNLVIVTHGYSKTVRDALAYVLDGLGRDQPTVIVADSRMETDNFDSPDARRMAFSLKQATVQRLQGRDEQHLRIVNGDVEILQDLHKGRKVLTLLGAECFDQADTRVIHPRGAVEMLLKMTHLDNFVAVIAESYKRVDISKLLLHSEDMHLQRLDVYTEKTLDMIIADDDVACSTKSRNAAVCNAISGQFP